MKKVKYKEHYHGKIHVVEVDKNGKEHDTGLFLCGGTYIVPDYSGLSKEELEILAEKNEIICVLSTNKNMMKNMIKKSR